MNIERDRDAGTLKLSQPTMTNDLVTKHGLSDARTKTYPLSSSLKLSKQDGELLQSQARLL
jgi:hypothetical protein